MSETTIYAATNDAVLRSVNADWATRRAGTGSMYEYPSSTSTYIGSWANTLAVWLGGFDTSVIGTDTITAVEFGIWCDTNEITNTPTFKLVAFDYDTEPGTEDWIAGADLSGYTLLSSLAGAGQGEGEYAVFASSANFIAAINKTGLTKLYLYPDYLELSSQPNANDNDWEVSLADSAHKPYLKITHEAAAAPATLHNLTMMGAGTA